MPDIECGPGEPERYAGPQVTFGYYSFKRRQNEKPYLGVEIMVGERKVGTLWVSPSGKRVRWFQRLGHKSPIEREL